MEEETEIDYTYIDEEILDKNSQILEYRAKLDWDKAQVINRLNQLKDAYNQAHQTAAREESFSATRGVSRR